ncbi:MAG: DUF2083 domain-containing protein [Alphaproteobacteria bacterium]|nr:DUF2083 domain-containing protein [Alphaproteobacteria bacterium]MCB9797370.1 DUF2083 domain-containing protein [Alphaproteobacteria bacterium]
MTTPQRLGAKVRSLRRREGLTQKAMAERLDISASYLNLIEHDKRPLPAHLLIQLAVVFHVDLQAFAADEDEQLTAELIETFGDPLFDDEGLTTADAREAVAATPAVARALLSLYRGYRDARERAEVLAGRIGDAPRLTALPQDEVEDLLQRHLNHFPSLELAAERLRRDAHATDSDRYGAMARYLEQAHGVRVRWASMAEAHGLVRRFDVARKELVLSELLPPRSRHFQLAHQLGLLCAAEEIEALVDDRRLTSPEAVALARVALANYFAGAALMPYAGFWQAARETRYDIELLGHRYRTSFEQVCHRLTTLRRPHAEGVPFHLMRVDIAGNISKRYSGSGIRFARYSGACPRWNVHAAFLTPGQIRRQVSVMPDGTAYFCVARTVSHAGGGWRAPHAIHAVGLGCALEHAPQVVYADGLDLERPEDVAVPVGVTCRTCERDLCPQRAFPQLHGRLRIDPNLRGVNPFVGPAQEG